MSKNKLTEVDESDAVRTMIGDVELIDQLRNFVRSLAIIQDGTKAGDYQKWFLRKSRGWSGRVQTESDPDARNWARLNGPLPKYCYHNAQKWSLARRDVSYVEGWVFNGTIPLEHGWNLAGGKVIDLTLDAADQFLGRTSVPRYELDRTTYLGIEVPRRMILRSRRENDDDDIKVLWWLFINEPEGVPDA